MAVALPVMRSHGAAASASSRVPHAAAQPATAPLSNPTPAAVATERVAPRTRDLFPAKLIAVDDELPGASSQQTFRLAPGRHVLIVAEMIEHEYFSSIANMQRGRHRRDGYKTLEVDIQPGVTYFLAARFHRDRSGSILDGGYWQPVLWKERVEPCR